MDQENEEKSKIEKACMDEVERRKKEVENGEVEMISQEEFEKHLEELKKKDQ